MNKAINDHGMSAEMSGNVCIDLDGVIADFYSCKEGCQYTGYPNCELKRLKCPVMAGAREAMVEIRKRYRIVILTGRVESERNITVQWLRKNGIPYDELVMNKPRAFIYIDDFGHRFDGWDKVMTAIQR